MTKIKFLTVISLLAFISCSKDGGEDTIPAPVQVNENTFNAYFKDGFTGSKGEELIKFRNIDNIRTGDMVPYVLTITDTKAESDVSYVFTPVTDESKSHQSKGIDYDLFIKEGDEIKKVETTDFVYKQTGSFEVFIKPLVAGTFQIPFVFEKKVDGKVIETIKTKVVFNAVTITATSKGWRAGWVWEGIEQFSDNRRNYRFKVDDGNGEKDIYLQPQGVAQFFRVKYKQNDTGEQSFQVDNEYEFHPIQGQRYADPPLDPSVVTITIIQRRVGEAENRITYYNVPIIATN